MSIVTYRNDYPHASHPSSLIGSRLSGCRRIWPSSSPVLTFVRCRDPTKRP